MVLTFSCPISHLLTSQLVLGPVGSAVYMLRCPVGVGKDGPGEPDHGYGGGDQNGQCGQENQDPGSSPRAPIWDRDAGVQAAPRISKPQGPRISRGPSPHSCFLLACL